MSGAGGDSEVSNTAMLTWSDLCVQVSSRKKPNRTILQNATGYAEPGSIMAIMGPSGSGKSTLLDTLAGRLAPNAIQTGDILLNGERKTTLSYGIAVGICYSRRCTYRHADRSREHHVLGRLKVAREDDESGEEEGCRQHNHGDGVV